MNEITGVDLAILDRDHAHAKPAQRCQIARCDIVGKPRLVTTDDDIESFLRGVGHHLLKRRSFLFVTGDAVVDIPLNNVVVALGDVLLDNFALNIERLFLLRV